MTTPGLITRFYPSSEHFLYGIVPERDVFDYVFKGFALANINGELQYFSCNLEKPQVFIPADENLNELFRQKDEQNSNISGLITLLSKFKTIGRHYGNSTTAWDKIRDLLSKEEFSSILENYKVSIESRIELLFPGYPY